MNQVPTSEIIEMLANNYPKLLEMICLLPSMKYDKDFVLSEWKNKARKISRINANIDYRDYSFFAVFELYHDANDANRFPSLFKIIYYKSSNNYICKVIDYTLEITIQIISDLIDVCKNENFEELLNFL